MVLKGDFELQQRKGEGSSSIWQVEADANTQHTIVLHCPCDLSICRPTEEQANRLIEGRTNGVYTSCLAHRAAICFSGLIKRA